MCLRNDDQVVEMNMPYCIHPINTTEQCKSYGAEMGMNPSAHKALAVYNIFNVLGMIACVSVIVSINNTIFCCIFSAIIPIIVLTIFCIASKCKYQDMMIIHVHFNTILSTLWFIAVCPVFVLACVMGINFDYSETVGARLLAVTVITGVISVSSAISVVWGIWKSAQNVVLLARIRERHLDHGVVRGYQPYEASTCTNCNCMEAGQDHSDEAILVL
ncbi:hypothetical protein ACJMK2_028389 [Sinanodonta woodiana]|uniref:Uncharacterized protein n=1 Tax=Sinanodonta woodiana TaxID=1069815 RepID=A0ABD3XAI6_SINWO